MPFPGNSLVAVARAVHWVPAERQYISGPVLLRAHTDRSATVETSSRGKQARVVDSVAGPKRLLDTGMSRAVDWYLPVGT